VHRSLHVAAGLAAAAIAVALVPSASGQPPRRTSPRPQECGTAGHRTSAQDETWLMTGMQGDRFEIIGGTAAQAKGATADMKAFGARLVKDHSKSLREAERTARRYGIDIPKTPSPSERWELRTVGQFTGAAFDRSYADLEVQDHIQDIQETSDEIHNGCNVTVRGLARTDLPVLRQHLAIARRLKASGA
jgi:putative membrane protein